MASLNKVFLIGNLTRDPELRYIPSGSAVATFTVAVNRVFKSQAGEKKEQTSFLRVVVWGRLAEVCGEYLSKGNPVFVEGRLQSRDWQTQDGQKRSTVEVVADNIQFLKMGTKNPAAGAKDTGKSEEEIATIDLNSEGPSEVDSKAAGSGDGKPGAMDEAQPFMNKGLDEAPF